MSTIRINAISATATSYAGDAPAPYPSDVKPYLWVQASLSWVEYTG